MISPSAATSVPTGAERGCSMYKGDNVNAVSSARQPRLNLFYSSFICERMNGTSETLLTDSSSPAHLRPHPHFESRRFTRSVPILTPQVSPHTVSKRDKRTLIEIIRCGVCLWVFLSIKVRYSRLPFMGVCMCVSSAFVSALNST